MCEHSFTCDITMFPADDCKRRLNSCFYLQAATTPSVPLSFQIQYVQLRTIMFQVHVQLERACASFKTSPPPAIATSLAMTTGEEIHKYGHVVEQVMLYFARLLKRLLRMLRNLCYTSGGSRISNLLFSQIFLKTMKTRMHSSRMRIVHCNGCLCCHTCPPAMHAPLAKHTPLPRMPPFATHAPLHHARLSFTTHVLPLPRTPPPSPCIQGQEKCVASYFDTDNIKYCCQLILVNMFVL